MGRTTRWLRSLLGGKKEEKGAGFSSSSSSEEKREKKRWSFKAGRDSADIGSNRNPIPPGEDGALWLRTFYSENEKEQNKHAIAVAAASAAAADAAVAAAQAAVAVVRLTGKGRAEAFQQRFAAAIKIQTVFRGYLAKRALRALKALVRLQALVRGYLVRKQAAATLQSMQALIRAQSTVRTQKCRNLLASHRREFVPRKSLERHEEASIHSRRLSANPDSPKIVEIDTCRSKSRSSRSRTSRSLIDSTEDAALNSISSPLPPGRISIPDCHNFQEYDWCRYSATAQSTPRYTNPVTPAKSVSAADVAFRRFLSSSNCPGYMSSTQSFEAKVRSQSAPKQRPEAGPRKRVPLSEVLLESRASLSGVGMQRSCNRIQEAFNFNFNFKNAVMDRSVELGRESSDQELHYLQRKW